MKDTKFNLLMKLAEQGFDAAQYALGDMYYDGGEEDEVPIDDKKAIEWYSKAAEQGHALAQFKVAAMYEFRSYTPRDEAPNNYKKAVEWYSKAAEQGDFDAYRCLGRVYSIGGKGIAQDYKKALYWYSKAAERGDTEAQVGLGMIYADGLSVPQDYVMAHMFFNIAAAAADYHKGDKHRDILEKRMTPSQIEKGQELAREWMQTHQ